MSTDAARGGRAAVALLAEAREDRRLSREVPAPRVSDGCRYLELLRHRTQSLWRERAKWAK